MDKLGCTLVVSGMWMTKNNTHQIRLAHTRERGYGYELWKVVQKNGSDALEFVSIHKSKKHAVQNIWA
ncbi:hypothetical protein [Streptomyces sp. CoH17]|uniref:hypothetical protein n=1 Tax=Streptomyces sp. CoH17 TaxID=2992806 RepID=UPI00226E39C3|nr:hypothetical protein [Streptomyces sp. CoH17]